MWTAQGPPKGAAIGRPPHRLKSWCERYRSITSQSGGWLNGLYDLRVGCADLLLLLMLLLLVISIIIIIIIISINVDYCFVLINR